MPASAFPPLRPDLTDGGRFRAAPQRRRVFDIHGNDVRHPTDAPLLTYRDAGILIVTSGHIVACDAYMANDHPVAWARRITPGRYPVQTVSAAFADGDERTALGVLRVSPGVPIRFELAHRPDEDPVTLRPGELFAYGVDHATGCFCDADAAALLSRSQNDPPQWAESLDAQLRTSISTADVAIDTVTGLNLIAFPSGWGDGSYASFWGFGVAGEVVCLVTDFDVVDVAFDPHPSRAPWWRRLIWRAADLVQRR